ncbi:MAG: UDP-2,3-diacylglucosamine diphosphatase [Pseudomonadota bacterium]
MARREETLFISDLHLSSQQPGILALFLNFLSERAPQAEALYILGDLFDAWIGDDDPAPPAPDVITALRNLSETSTRLYFAHGNRDFLMGEVFAKATGATLLPEPACVDLYGTPTLLAHGDLFCTGDTLYQAFRHQVRQPAVIRHFLALPLPERRAIAAEYRRKSGEAAQIRQEDIIDVDPRTICEAMRDHGARRLIHGHTHRPGQEDFELDGQSACRWVLADWRPEGSQALCVSPAGIVSEAV